jgi:hypothetical protein
MAAARVAPLVVAFLAAAATAAPACPVCVTETGAAVRAGIAADFATTLAAVLAPFPVLAATVALLHRGWPAWARRKGDRP